LRHCRLRCPPGYFDTRIAPVTYVNYHVVAPLQPLAGKLSKCRDLCTAHQAMQQPPATLPTTPARLPTKHSHATNHTTANTLQPTPTPYAVYNVFAWQIHHSTKRPADQDLEVFHYTQADLNP